MKITLHSKDECPYCIKTKEFLKENSISYEEILHNDFTERNEFYDSLALNGQERFVPQLFVEDIDGKIERIAGYTGLKSSGLLDRINAGNFNEDF